MLSWNAIPGAPRRKGVESHFAYTGLHSRFCLYEVWAWDGKHLYTRYRLRDASTVSDADVKAGRRPLVVWEGDDWREALAFVAVT